jgi:uncharacterized repeat protein (TIGR01451 family)
MAVTKAFVLENATGIGLLLASRKWTGQRCGTAEQLLINGQEGRVKKLLMRIRSRSVLTVTLMVFALALLAPLAANAQVTVFHVKVQVDSVTYCDAGTAGCSVTMGWSFPSTGLTLNDSQTLVLTQTGFLSPPGNPGFPNFDTSDKVSNAGATPCGTNCPVSIFIDTGTGFPATPQYGPATASPLNSFAADTGTNREGLDFSTVATAPNYTLGVGYADSTHPGTLSVGKCTSTTTQALCVPGIWDGSHGTTAATSFQGTALSTAPPSKFTDCDSYCFDAGAVLITGVGVPQLRVRKDPKGAVFTQGQQVSFSIVVTNTATAGTAKNVQLHDTLPGNGGLQWTTVTTTKGTCSIASNVLSCSLGDLAPQQFVMITVTSTNPTPAAACQSQPNPDAHATADNAPPADDSGSLTCTPPPPSNMCPLTQGFWKNHFPGAWPSSVLANGLKIGSKTYTAAQLEANLETPPSGGNALLILSHQLIAAKLNILNGSNPIPIAATITAADAAIDGLNINVDFVAAGSALGMQMTALADTLDSYNSSLLTPTCTGPQ